MFTGSIVPDVAVRAAVSAPAHKSRARLIAVPEVTGGKVRTRKTVIPAAQLASNEHLSHGIRMYRVTEFAEDEGGDDFSNTGIEVIFRAPRHKTFSYTKMMPSGLVQGRLRSAKGCYYPDLFRVNQQGNLASLNLLPIMKEGRIVLVRLKHSGTMVADGNVNEEISSLCDHQGQDIGSKMWVDHIEGNIVFVRSLAWAEAEYFLQVRVEADGRLQMLSYRVKRERDSDPILGLETGPEDRRYE